MNIKQKTATKNDLIKLYKSSACTMIGFIPSELNLYIEELYSKDFINSEITVYTTKGKEINDSFDLVGDKMFKNDLNIFIIDLDCMKNISKFSVSLRFERGYRWLDDIINNSKS